jgi:hypothetical protein
MVVRVLAVAIDRRPGSRVPHPTAQLSCAGGNCGSIVAVTICGLTAMPDPSSLASRLSRVLAEAEHVLGGRQLAHLLFCEADRLRRRLDDEAMARRGVPDGDVGDAA